MKTKASQSPTRIKVLKRGSVLRERWRISSFARENLTTRQAHQQIQKNGSVPSPNPFYDGRQKPEDSFKALDSLA